MKKYIFLMATLCFYSNYSYSFSGNDISRFQMNNHPLDQGFFYGYVNGVLESTFQNICIPKNVSDKQLGLVIQKYMQEHPEDLHQRAVEIIIKAVKNAWPCKK
jgi:hypothetical protein